MSDGTELATALVRLSHLVQRVFTDASRDHDLTQPQAQLLCALTPGPVGMTELSRILHLEKSSLTGLVDRVERRGLVARVRDDHDRRACQIQLTETGAELGERAHNDVVDRLDELTAGMPAEQRELVAAALFGLTTQTETGRQVFEPAAGS
ncbi:MarR family winged helix-turn-helix transcriptional regulator [Amycolatopsis sp. 195334CR]|uniref:MarR family winged helix-turn-helix transcriptional regulator n=1 Tax=Amycolatopsis sp. 195334CR TaxID=2814588 RepID=UPI001A8CB50D|nr:MarR family transcriptional regulator [Amycolatopsis sp. 195334CR]MBN6033912.1 MarR family transcriptional regulator [Amycolatopsis sp. 195334CR]